MIRVLEKLGKLKLTVKFNIKIPEVPIQDSPISGFDTNTRERGACQEIEFFCMLQGFQYSTKNRRRPEQMKDPFEIRMIHSLKFKGLSISKIAR